MLEKWRLPSNARYLSGRREFHTNKSLAGDFVPVQLYLARNQNRKEAGGCQKSDNLKTTTYGNSPWFCGKTPFSQLS